MTPADVDRVARLTAEAAAEELEAICREDRMALPPELRDLVVAGCEAVIRRAVMGGADVTRIAALPDAEVKRKALAWLDLRRLLAERRPS